MRPFTSEGAFFLRVLPPAFCFSKKMMLPL